jgi:hypothetical protein
MYNIFHSKALQNIPKLGLFGRKRNHLATLPPTVNLGGKFFSPRAATKNVALHAEVK